MTTGLRATTPSENTGAFTGGDWALFTAIAAIWGASFLLIDIGLESIAPGVITFLRVGLGAAVLLPLRAARTRIEREDRGRLVVLSVLWVAVPFTLFPIAEQHINSSVTGMLNGGTPIFVAIFGVLFFAERPTPAQLVGLGLGLGGVVTISVAQGGEGDSAWFGIAMVVAATVCYGFSINLAASLQRTYGSITVMAKMLGLATIWTAPFATAELADTTFETGPVVAVVVLGAVGTGAAFLIMGSLVGRVGSTRAAFITFLIPVVSMALGMAFRGDEVQAFAVVGVVLVVVGALLASRRVQR